ncbi:MAG: DUF4258 domain-containing protein [Candidatus Omnitrophica bacterium]|nr:DUF4258 domain-containing protein [Candidatus Omnitrophota bacterium]
MDIRDIIEAILSKKVRISDHAIEEADEDHLTFDEIYYSVIHGKIIEKYPVDTPYPSCLISGETFEGNPVHSVWAYNQQNQWAVLITVYRPDPGMWINWKKRRNKR